MMRVRGCEYTSSQLQPAWSAIKRPTKPSASLSYLEKVYMKFLRSVEARKVREIYG
jgi:hypothetical protein